MAVGRARETRSGLPAGAPPDLREHLSDERAHIDALMEQLHKVADASHDAGAIEAATQALAKGTEAFAAERMNHSIQQALAGKNVEAI